MVSPTSAALLTGAMLAAVALPIASSLPGLSQPPAAHAADADFGPEVISNTGFDDGYEPWWVTPDLTMQLDDGALCVDVAGNTPTAWSSIVGFDGIDLKNGDHYHLRFTVSGTTEATIRALVQMGVNPYTAAYEGNPVLQDEPTEYYYAFTSKMDVYDGQLVFQLGGAAEDWRFCLDDVSFTTGPEPVAYVPETGPKVRVNQHGYLPNGPKRATLISDADAGQAWQLRDGGGSLVAEGTTAPQGNDRTVGAAVHTIDFSEVTAPGEGYTLAVGEEISHPFAIAADLYRQLRYDSLNYFYLARSGIEIDAAIVGEEYARAAGHLNKSLNQGDYGVACQEPRSWYDGWSCDYTLDVIGGWYDAGDHGKYVVNGGIAVHQLMSIYERTLTAPSARAGALDDGTLDIPEHGNGVPDVLDEAKWELEWMLRMQVPAGKPLAGMLHHKVQDTKWTGLPLLPDADPEPRRIHRPSTAATLNFAAVAAQGARLYTPYYPEFADELLAASRIAWQAALENPELFASPADGNDGGGPYDDRLLDDEFYWAAAELYLTTGEQGFLDFVLASPEHEGDFYEDGGFSWGSVTALGRMDLATVPSDIPGRDAIRASVVETADRYLEVQQAQAFGHPYGPRTARYDWGSNSIVLNNQVVLATAYDLTGEAKYRDAVIEAMDYLLGRNGMNTSYITGYGTVYSENQHSRWFARQLTPNLPNPPRGTVAGGPNSSLQDPIASALFTMGCPAQLCYVDHIQAWSVNEMTVNWNSALSWVASFVDDQSGDDGGDGAMTAALIAGGAVLAAGAGVVIGVTGSRSKRRREGAATADADSRGADSADADADTGGAKAEPIAAEEA